MKTVFVYGTLKEGFYNHSIMQYQKGTKNKQFIQNIEGFGLYVKDGQGFPFVKPQEGESVEVEAWDVKDTDMLDMLEGYHGKNNPYNFYERAEVTSKEGTKGYIYFRNDEITPNIKKIDKF